MPKNFTRTLTRISTALDDAYRRALEQEKVEGVRGFDLRNERLVIFSDHHRGSRDGADDFRICESAYHAALAYYDRLGYTLAVLGDVEELWEEWPEATLKAYAHTLELEGRFHQDGRYLRFWGNHDDAWSHADMVEKLLTPALGGRPLKVHEGLILHVRDGEKELGQLFLIHGHQGTLDSGPFTKVSRFFLRHVWRPIQRVIKYSFNTPARDFTLRFEHDSAMYYWAQSREKLVLIVGHTHRPVFKSESHEDVIRKAIQEAEQKLARKPDADLQQQVAELAAEWEWTHTRNLQTPAPVPLIEFKKPSYFNSGCCAFRDGDVTGLEFTDGEIRLVRWPDDEDAPRPKVLAKAKLAEVFAAC